MSMFQSGLLVPSQISRVTTRRSAGSVAGANPPLLIGGGTSNNGVLTAVTSVSAARAFWGARSMLAQMVAAYRAIDPVGTLYAIGVADDASGVPEVRTLTFSGTATESGTVALYIGGTRIEASVASGAAASAVAASVEAAWDLSLNLPFTASVSGAVVTITATQDGPSHTQVDIRHSYQSGEKLPAGISLAFATTTAGATAPSIATAITAMADEGFDYIGLGYSDTTNVGLLETEMGHTSGRWATLRENYGFAVTSKIDSSANLISYGGARNAPHVCVVGVASSPTMPWVVTAQVIAQARLSMDANPALGLTSLELPGVLPPATTGRFSLAARQTLIAAGMSTLRTVGGVTQIERLVSTYKTDSNGDPDISWQDATISAVMGRTLRTMKSNIATTYPRAVVVPDGTPVGADPDNKVVWPKAVTGTHVNTYRELEARGWLRDGDLFAVEASSAIDGDTPGRINSTLPLRPVSPYIIGAIDAVLITN